MGSIRERFAADVSAKMLSTAYFAQTATFTPAGGGGTQITGIFRDPHDPAAPAAVRGESSGPYWLCLQSAVPNVKRGDALTIDATPYTIIRVEDRRDRTNLVRLYLSLD